MWVKFRKKVKIYNRDGVVDWRAGLFRACTYRWEYRWFTRWEGKKKYVRKESHEKKILSEKEANRRAWREYKGFNKDKAKAGFSRDGCPPWMKRMCNKEYRAWVRNCIENERYEEIGSKTRKDFFDPWRWD